MTMTIQVKRAIEQLRQAGFERSEFSVYVERKYVGHFNGKRAYEYGRARIVMYPPKERIIERYCGLLVAGLSVMHVVRSDGRAGYPLVTTHHPPRFEVWDLRKESGRQIIEISVTNPEHPCFRGDAQNWLVCRDVGSLTFYYCHGGIWHADSAKAQRYGPYQAAVVVEVERLVLGDILGIVHESEVA